MTEEVSEWDDEEDAGSEVSSSKRDSLNPSSLDFWDYSVELECLKGPEDLQLAAELGKTLLERNKELEINLKEYQRLHDDQTKEIEYLTKQAAALRKTNDDRIRIYEQLEVSIQELERANQKLALDNSADKKQIKSLCVYRDTLELRCEDLQKSLDKARDQQQSQKEQIRNLLTRKNEEEETVESRRTTCATVISQTSIERSPSEEDLINQLTKENQELKNQMSKDQRKIADLEEEMSRRIQDMTLLTEEIRERETIVTSLRSKMSVLEDVRDEKFCMRCCKELDIEGSQPTLFLEDGQQSRAVPRGYQDPYGNWVEMHQLLAKKQWEKQQSYRNYSTVSPVNKLSLKDELRSSDHNIDFEEDEEYLKEKRKGEGRRSNGFSAAGADFSEEETSSGFSDETCNKSTQTERNAIPGSFLCSIADGDDCKFSIYDDACPIESRFRKTPEYRTLFREIFAVLKRAAQAKESGEQVPLLEDLSLAPETPKVPPATPAAEIPPLDFGDAQSLAESANASEAASETSSVVNERVEENLKDVSQDASGPSTATKDVKQTSDILEYISISVGVKKKSKRKSVDSPARKSGEGGESSSPNSPRKSSGRRRKDWRNYDSPRPTSRTQSPAVQPHILTTLERRDGFPDSQSKGTTSPWSFQPFVSTAAQEVAELKKLEKSYAEVLRHTPKNFARAKSSRIIS